MESTLPSQSPVSPFEDFLVRMPLRLLMHLFDTWEPMQIIRLGKASKQLRRITRFYMSMRWSVDKFTHRYLTKSEEALDLLEREGGLLFGPAVCGFFYRSVDVSCALDVCIHVRSTQSFAKMMNSEEYRFTRMSGGRETFEETVMQRLHDTQEVKLKSSGERNSREADRRAWGPFEFVRGRYQSFRRIRVHVVRCEPYRHILTLHSTGLMNIIGWNSAISLFPRSTFVYRRSFISRQECVFSDKFERSIKKWYDGYAAKKSVNIIGMSRRRYRTAETGPRFVGDSLCWMIPARWVIESEGMCVTDPDSVPIFSGGPRFEVLDWTSGVSRVESYMRIGEPRLWSKWTCRCLRQNSQSYVGIPTVSWIIVIGAFDYARDAGARGTAECQMADWPVHKVMCRFRAFRYAPWEISVMRFNDHYGPYAISYGVGAVFLASGIPLNQSVSPAEWRRVWTEYACVVVLRLVDGGPAGAAGPYEVKFDRVHAVRVADELPDARRERYELGIGGRDWSVGVLYKVVSREPENAVLSLTSVIRPMRPQDVTLPFRYVENMVGLGELLSGL
ncbi:hypothetical protein CVT26_009852 [Gymnopilus dilepis]|uniref:F-box domain-containing protein n=1 Tax=Gymnopilus dilepis TaxID=231916 RepID=A0A409YC31_9AGAR|nr:hypothetical protein CVT26_009852 [Gymnopilus dilepis]